MIYRNLFGRINDVIRDTDFEVAQLIRLETKRQETNLSLIPSENYVSAAVALSLASSFTNKYSEGYPHVWKDGQLRQENGRYYQGQENTNALERLVIDRALELFTDNPSDYHANVQVLSGSAAMLGVLGAFLKPGDTFMGLELGHGGHLTHGHKVSNTSQYYNAIPYKLKWDDSIDYDGVERLATTHLPKLIVCGATAYPLKIDFEAFARIAKSVGAILVADVSHICGLCFTGQHPHPFPHADVIVTTTHKILRGPRGGLIISKKEHGQKIDKAVFPGMQGGPHMNTIAGIAVALKEAMGDEYKEYAKQVVDNAKRLAECLISNGFKLVSGITENHLILIDIINSSVNFTAKNGSEMAECLEKAGIVVNKNTVPGDTKPWIPSGIRLGTPAVTTLGMKEADMERVADFITDAVLNFDDDEKLLEIKSNVDRFVKDFTRESKYIV